MAQLAAIAAFQSELKNKIQFKASSKISNDAVLFKAFKFFDLYNNGHLPKTDFFKAIAKCGVVVDTHNLDLIYRHYDPQNTGKIDYRVFIENLLFNNQSQTQSENLEKNQLHHENKSNQQQQSLSYNKPIQQYQQSDKKSQAHSHHSPSDKLKSSQYGKQPENYQQIIEIIANQLKGDGICGLLNLSNQLKSTDYERTHLINAQKMSPYFRYLSQQSISIIISQYNPTKYGQINYAELIYDLKGKMNLQRQSLVDDLFNMLDHEQRGEIQIVKLISSYRNRSEIGSFKRAIDLYCKFQSIDDGIFTDQDFNDFFEFISFAFTSDLSFNEFIKIGFYAEEPAKSSIYSSRSRRQFEPKKQVSVKAQSRAGDNQGDFRKNKQEELQQKRPSDPKHSQFHHEEIQNRSNVSHQSRRSQAKSQSQAVEIPQVKEISMILLRMKKTLASKGTRGFLQFQKLLKTNDTDNDERVNIDQFKQVIKDQKIDITPVEAIQIFGIFDHDKSGRIFYQELINTLKGQVPQVRLSIIARMWDRVKADEQHTTFSRIKSSLNFRCHPDILTGRKYDDQIWQEIQQTILMIQDLEGTGRSDTIYKNIFYEYCQNLSLSISEDQLFESIAQNFWKIGPLNKIQNEYAGSRKIFDHKKNAYLQDHHKYVYNGGTVSQNAPFGTFNIPTNYTTQHQKL